MRVNHIINKACRRAFLKRLQRKIHPSTDLMKSSTIDDKATVFER